MKSVVERIVGSCDERSLVALGKCSVCSLVHHNSSDCEILWACRVGKCYRQHYVQVAILVKISESESSTLTLDFIPIIGIERYRRNADTIHSKLWLRRCDLLNKYILALCVWITLEHRFAVKDARSSGWVAKIVRGWQLSSILVIKHCQWTVGSEERNIDHTVPVEVH